ncbi:hypothetical protein ABH975_003943 [Bradyrhizobium ottawaense]
MKIVKAVRDVVHGREIDQEQQQVSDIELPHPPQQPGCADDEATLHHHRAEYERRGVAGDQHEQIGAIAEAVVSRREPGERRIWNVPEKDQPVRQTAKQIQSHIAPLLDQHRPDRDRFPQPEKRNLQGPTGGVNGLVSQRCVLHLCGQFLSDRNRVAAHSRGTLGCVIDAGLTDIKPDRRTSQIFL